MNASPRTVIVTGASSGIGLALATAYLQRGFNVVGNARTLERLSAAAAGFPNADNFLPVAGDIADPDTARRLFEAAVARFGKVDILVNNAGVFIPKPVGEYSAADVDQMFDTNLRGFVYPTQQAATHMTANGGGHIVSISAAIAMQPTSTMPALLPVLVKGGINSATRALALELAPHNIMVNAVAPGLIATPLLSGVDPAYLNTLQPIGRIGATQDIVDAVLYLTDAQYTTGVVLAVDGGMTSGKW